MKLSLLILFTFIILLYICKLFNIREEFQNNNLTQEFLASCYDKNGNESETDYYYPAKDVSVTSKCYGEIDCNKPTYTNVMSHDKLYKISDKRKDTCLDIYPVLYIPLDKMLIKNFNNGVYKEFPEVSNYPNIINSNSPQIKKGIDTHIFKTYTRFNGKDDFISIKGKHLDTTKHIGFSIWINTPGNKNSCLIKKGYKGWSIDLESDNKVSFRVGNKLSKSSISFIPNKWTHIVLTAKEDSGNIIGKFMINGLSAGNININNTSLPTDNKSLIIGVNGTSKDNIVDTSKKEFSGMMRDLKLYHFYLNLKDFENEYINKIKISSIKLNKKDPNYIYDEISGIKLLFNKTLYKENTRYFNGLNNSLTIMDSKIPYWNRSWSIDFESKNENINNGRVFGFHNINLYYNNNKWKLDIDNKKIVLDISVDNQWHLHTFTFNNNILKYYQDMVELASVNTKPLVNKSEMVFGKNIGIYNNNYWNGFLRKINIYKDTLVLDERNFTLNNLNSNRERAETMNASTMNATTMNVATVDTETVETAIAETVNVANSATVVKPSLLDDDTLKIVNQQTRVSDELNKKKEMRVMISEEINNLMANLKKEVKNLESMKSVNPGNAFEEKRRNRLIKLQESLISEIQLSLENKIKILKELEDNEVDSIQKMLQLEQRMQENKLNILKKRLKNEVEQNKNNNKKLILKLEKQIKEKERLEKYAIENDISQGSKLSNDFLQQYEEWSKLKIGDDNNTIFTPYNKSFKTYSYTDLDDKLISNDIDKVYTNKTKLVMDQSLPDKFLCPQCVNPHCPNRPNVIPKMQNSDKPSTICHMSHGVSLKEFDRKIL